MKTIIAFVILLVVGCGGVSTEAPDAGGAAGIGGGAAGAAAAGSSGGAAGALPDASSAGAGGAGSSGTAGQGIAGAGGSAGIDAGAGGASAGSGGTGGSGAGGTGGVPMPMGMGLVDGKPWCNVARPAGTTVSCGDKFFPYTPSATTACGKTVSDPWWGTLACSKCKDSKNPPDVVAGCVTGQGPIQDFVRSDGSTLSCAGYSTLCVASCSECP